jgi:hypothetical protein
MNKHSDNSSLVQGDKNLPRLHPLDEDLDPRKAFYAIVPSEGYEINSEL